MRRERYLSAKFLLGVHTAGGSEGIIEQDESIALHIESQVRTRGEEEMEGKHRCFVYTWFSYKQQLKEFQLN